MIASHKVKENYQKCPGSQSNIDEKIKSTIFLFQTIIFNNIYHINPSSVDLLFGNVTNP